MERKCTDIMCLAIFALFWVGLIIVAVAGIQSGNPYALLYGKDYQDAVCGSTNTTGCGGTGCANFKQTVYPHLTADIISNIANGVTNPLNYQLFGVCTAQCPQALDWVCDYTGLSELESAGLLTSSEKSTRVILGSGAQTASPAGATLDTCYNTAQSNGAGAALGVSPWQFIPFGNPCRSYLKYCSIIPSTQDSYFFRCIGLINTNSSSVDTCTRPAGIAATDPACVQKQTVAVTTTTQAAQSDPLQQQLSSFAAVVNNYVGDLVKCYSVVFTVGLVVSFFLGFVWIQFLKYCAGCMVWFTLILVELLWIAATLLMYSKAGLISTTTFINLATHVGLTSVVNNTLSSATSSLPSWVTSTSTQYATTYTWVAYIFTVLAVLFLVLVIAMVRRVAIAINVIKEASRAAQAMPTMMLYPAFEFFLISGMGLYFFIIFSYLHTSSGLSGTVLNAYANVSTSGSSVQINTNSSVPGVNSTDLAALNSIVGSTTISAIQYAQLYHFFGLLWTNQFISGIGIMTIAGAVSSWYWTADKKSLGPHQTFLSFKRVVRYHLGSIAFGAFLIAVIQFIRAIFAYLDEKSKKLQQTNIAVKIFFKVVQCCLWCFEKCMKYINRNSYIMTAMIGCNFCSGTGKALAILVMNLAQVATMNFVGMLMLVMGKIVISATCAFVGYIILTTFPDYTAGGQFALSSTVFPIFVLTLLAYFVANAFLEVYNMSIDTIILNFCIDRRDNNGVDKPYYMGDSLRKFVDNGGSTAELVASTKKGGDDDDDVAVGKPIEDAAAVDNPLIAKAEAKDE